MIQVLFLPQVLSSFLLDHAASPQLAVPLSGQQNQWYKGEAGKIPAWPPLPSSLNLYLFIYSYSLAAGLTGTGIYTMKMHN